MKRVSMLFAALLVLLSMADPILPWTGPAVAANGCMETIDVGETVDGEWDNDCQSTNRSGSHARFYTFTLSSDMFVDIQLESSEDAYLYLLRGEGTDGDVIEEDDDGGYGSNSWISMELPAGTYTIEATAYESRVTGSFTLSLIGSTPGGGECIDSIRVGESVSGSWESGCRSTNRSGSYARFYTFTLSSDSVVEIQLESSEDTYLYLLRGDDTQGTILEQDDDGGSGSDSWIEMQLPAGTYTIEATTYESRTTGSFRLSLQETGPLPECSVGSMDLGDIVDGEWDSDCRSMNRSGSYARFYVFSLSSDTAVDIDLESSEDAYLYLLRGEGIDGAVIDEDDDGGAGGDSWIGGRLSAGTYTIEATTYDARTQGRFTLSLQETGPLPECALNPIDLGETVEGEWDSDCQSANRGRSYARYYTFSLSADAVVDIELESEEDAYLYLLRGEGTDGAVIVEDDDGGSGGDSWIERQLPAGTYTIEATTYDARTPGRFTLSLRTGEPLPECSVDTIDLGETVEGSWDSDCRSANRSGSYARFYTFRLSSDTDVAIDLESSEDAYLYLLEGSGTMGRAIDEDDDGGSGSDARISARLSAGTYAIEATTYDGRTTGSFTLSLRGSGSIEPPPTSPADGEHASVLNVACGSNDAYMILHVEIPDYYPSMYYVGTSLGIQGRGATISHVLPIPEDRDLSSYIDSSLAIELGGEAVSTAGYWVDLVEAINEALEQQADDEVLSYAVDWVQVTPGTTPAIGSVVHVTWPDDASPPEVILRVSWQQERGDTVDGLDLPVRLDCR